MPSTTEKRVFDPSDSAEFCERLIAERRAKDRKQAKKRAKKPAKGRARRESVDAAIAATRRNYGQITRATGGARRQVRLIG